MKVPCEHLEAVRATTAHSSGILNSPSGTLSAQAFPSDPGQIKLGGGGGGSGGITRLTGRGGSGGGGDSCGQLISLSASIL